MTSPRYLRSASRSSRKKLDRFRKEVIRVGTWTHPEKKYEIEVTPEILVEMASETNRLIADGNKVPFPDGHSTKTKDNMGFWDEFEVEDDKLYGFVKAEAGHETAVGKTIKDVSVCWLDELTTGDGEKYTNVLEHVAATNYPVIGKQENFIKLSRNGSEEKVPLLELAKDDPCDDDDCSTELDRVLFQQFTDDEQDCIGRKISTLKDEGITGDQAVAIAIKECAPEKARSMARIMLGEPEGDPEMPKPKEKTKQAAPSSVELDRERQARKEAERKVADLERKEAERSQEEKDALILSVREYIVEHGSPDAAHVKEALHAIDEAWDRGGRTEAKLLAKLTCLTFPKESTRLELERKNEKELSQGERETRAKILTKGLESQGWNVEVAEDFKSLVAKKDNHEKKLAVV